ncbi:hypothetical protein [Alloprevotella tannerae]|uniref:hypothetical protein n=1 Tax=Alloprevotella tannerae TaxID=76122 RepID=UPI00288BF764|nr:hypothetical protein [Alloprevotella tannerae]
MLSEKIKNYLIESRLYDDTADEAYQKVISNLGIDLETPFAQFNLYTNAVTFTGNRAELYNVCWFAINSIYYEQMASMRSVFRLPEEYIPLDSFEGEGGFFYNRNTGEVLELTLGQVYEDFQQGRLKPQWPDFNIFLEWYFDLS